MGGVPKPGSVSPPLGEFWPIGAPLAGLPVDAPGERIGAYRVGGLLGRGVMGERRRRTAFAQILEMIETTVAKALCEELIETVQSFLSFAHGSVLRISYSTVALSSSSATIEATAESTGAVVRVK